MNIDAIAKANFEAARGTKMIGHCAHTNCKRKAEQEVYMKKKRILCEQDWLSSEKGNIKNNSDPVKNKARNHVNNPKNNPKNNGTEKAKIAVRSSHEKSAARKLQIATGGNADGTQ